MEKKQHSIPTHIINIEENDESDLAIQEYFFYFINVDSATGWNLTEVSIEQLTLYNINIRYCRG